MNKQNTILFINKLLIIWFGDTVDALLPAGYLSTRTGQLLIRCLLRDRSLFEMAAMQRKNSKQKLNVI
jgi:hypothetical protein